MSKIKWVIWSINKDSEVVANFWFGFKPKLSKIYKAMHFSGDLKKYGFISFESLEKSNFWLDFDKKIKFGDIN
jgi:hypothetical protein